MRWIRAVLLALVLLPAGAGVASAHAGGLSPASSEPRVQALEPPVPGLRVTVIEAGARLRMDNATAVAVRVLPAAGDVVDTLPTAAPGGVARWSDPRVAAAAAAGRPTAGTRAWAVPMLVGGQPVTVRGEQVWPAPPPAGLWWLATLGLAAGVALVGVAGGGRPWGPAALGVATLAVTATHVGHIAGSSLVPQGQPFLLMVASAAGIGLLAWPLAVVGAVLAVRGARSGPFVCCVSGALLAVLGAPADVIGFHRAVLPFAWGADLDRLTTAVTVGGGLGLAVAGAVVLHRLQRTLDHPVLRPALRGLALVLTAYVVGTAFLGPEGAQNPAPYALYVLAWVGLVPVSLLAGPVWRVVNPLRALHAGLTRALRVPPDGVRPLPKALGYWPAAASLTAFVWLELVAPDRDAPAVVGGWLLGYAAVHTAAALVFGAGWFDRGEGFEVYSALIGSLAVLGRAPDGRYTWRTPLRGVAATPGGPGLVAVLAVWWGSTVFDGLTGTSVWAPFADRLDVPPWLAGAVTLATLTVVVGAGYRLATRGGTADALAHSLVPIAVGYTVAHYTSLLITDGPRGLALLASVHQPAPHAVPAPVLVATIQVLAILVGHVLGVLAAHDRALAVLPEHRRLADQVPLVLLMVAYTMVGLLLLVLD